MSQASKIALLKEMLDSAESNIRSAKQILSELTSGTAKSQYAVAAAKVGSMTMSGEKKVIEGVFDGQNMIGPDKKTYSVPANYASKSKLVPGDVLKLSINEDGSFVYKQIGPVERKRIVGTLTYEDGQYQVIGTGKVYKVLLASVTYFRAEIGDRVTLMIPELEDSEWGAIENVLPKEEGQDIDMEDLDL
jgi:archaellum component FlaG (FlaF/FlaG flagellin family)